MQRVPRPNKATPLLEQDGLTISQPWFDFLGYLDAMIAAGISGAVDVQLTSIANGQVLIWNSTDKKFENGAN